MRSNLTRRGRRSSRTSNSAPGSARRVWSQSRTCRPPCRIPHGWQAGTHADGGDVDRPHRRRDLLIWSPGSTRDRRGRGRGRCGLAGGGRQWHDSRSVQPPDLQGHHGHPLPAHAQAGPPVGRRTTPRTDPAPGRTAPALWRGHPGGSAATSRSLFLTRRLAGHVSLLIFGSGARFSGHASGASDVETMARLRACLTAA